MERTVCESEESLFAWNKEISDALFWKRYRGHGIIPSEQAEAMPERKKRSMRYLIIIDVQNDFVSGSLGTAEAQQMLPRLTEKF